MKQFLIVVGVLMLLGTLGTWVAHSKLLSAQPVAKCMVAPRSTEQQRVDCFRNLAEDGDAAAQLRLGMFYWTGRYGVLQDQVEAAKWFYIASNQNQDGGITVEVSKFEEMLTEEQIAAARQKAQEWIGSHPRAERKEQLLAWRA